MEAAVREFWGGQLCIAAPTHPTREELEQLAVDISGTPGILTADVGRGDTAVKVDAWVAYEGLWRELVQEYGADVIDLRGILQPIEEPRHE